MIMYYEKKYKDALERARDYYKANLKLDKADENLVLEDIFPELAESEDEKVRKGLIKYFKNFDSESIYTVGLNEEEILAWLEKQGEQQETLCDKCKKGQPSHSCQDITALGRCAIEKQSEQKPFDYENATIVQKDFAPKEEPKFKVGDWIISNNKNSTYQVIEVKRGIYVIRDNADNHEYHIGVEECEKSGRLWTISDAKDGDVLYLQKDGKEHIIIYKGIIKERFRTFVSAYCAYNGIVDAFCFADVSRYADYADIAYEDIMPATKEQRDLLFAKMHEAGYEWDTEKKELKLLITNGGDFCESENCEQNPAWSEDETSIAVKNPDAYKIGFADGEAHAKEEMQSSWSEAMYNFVNKWKSGKFGEVPLQKALSTKFDDYFNSVLDKANELEYQALLNKQGHEKNKHQ